ncbi:hypothetical protein EV426DRAFT_638091 [Tirmania nivea]|nr:hypothetical protein EV426DRAFT_638091 [Tirmania nivea]
MELPKPPQKGHSRAPSNETSRKLVASPRRRTLGPLDLGDTRITHPLQAPPSATPTPTAASSGASPPPKLSTSPRPPPPAREFPHLLHPHLFHPLPNHDLPLPFRQSSAAQPAPNTPLPTLLAQGYFRAAAITCAALLPTLSPSNHTEIFNLWYIRLSCLCLIGATQTAYVEVKALEDLSAPAYWAEEPPAAPAARPQKRHLVPWELRLLAIRLQALSFSDWRRALVFYYELAREARVELRRAINRPTTAATTTATTATTTTNSSDQAQIKLWKARLKDLSIRVASALVEMGDLAAAARHLESLRAKGGDADAAEEDAKVRYMLSLLYIRIGNYSAAKAALPPAPPAPAEAQPQRDPLAHPTQTALYTDHILASLLRTALGHWEASITAWSTPPPPTAGPPQPAVLERQNLAVSLVYTGRLAQARDILEDLIEEGNAFFALTFNLCTVWELLTDGEATKERKREVAEKVVAGGGRREAGAGWFKM